MSQYDLKINVTSNVGSANRSLETLNVKLSKITTNSSDAFNALNKLAKVSFSSLNTDFSNMSKSMGSLATKINRVATNFASLKTTKSTMKDIAREATMVKNSFETLAKSTTGVNSGIGRMSRTATGNLRKVTTEGQKVSASIKSIGNATSSANASLSQVGKGAGNLKNVRNDVNGLNKSLKNVSRSSSGINTVGASIQSMGKKVRHTNKLLLDMKTMLIGIAQARMFHSLFIGIDNLSTGLWEAYKNAELLEKSLNRVTGSQDITDDMIAFKNEMVSMSGVSEYEINKVIKGFMGLGYSAKETKTVVMSMMEGIAGTTGEMTYFEQVGRGFLQVATNGKLMGEELLQIGEASIPMKQLVSDMLGLTADQRASIGKLNIESRDAIMLMSKALTDNYGGALKGIQDTTQGTTNTLRADFMLLARDIATPLMESFSVILSNMGAFVKNVKTIFDQVGIGEVLKTLIPPDLLYALYSIITAFSQFGLLLRSFIPFVGFMLSQFIQIGNVLGQFVAPIFFTLGHVIQGITSFLMQHATMVKVVLGLYIGFQVVTKISMMLMAFQKVLIGMGSALSLFAVRLQGASMGMVSTAGVFGATTLTIKGALMGLVTSFKMASIALLSTPLGWLLLGGTLVAGTALASSIGKAKKESDNLQNSIGGMFGDKNPADDMKEMSQGMNETGNSANNLASDVDKTGDSIEELGKKTKKASKSVLSFDEVFTLSESSMDDIGGQLDDIIKKMGELDSIYPDFTIPTPDLDKAFKGIEEQFAEFQKWMDEYDNNWMDGSFSDGWNSFTEGFANVASLLWGIVGGAFMGLKDIVMTVLTVAGTGIMNFCTTASGALQSFAIVVGYLGTVFFDLLGTIAQWSIEGLGHVVRWCDATFTAFTGWFGKAIEAHGTFWSDNLSNWKTYVDEVIGHNLRLVGDLTLAYGEWFIKNTAEWVRWKAETFIISANWVLDTLGNFTTWAGQASIIFGDWFLEQSGSWIAWGVESLQAIGTFVGGSLEKFGAWVTGNKEQLDEIDRSHQSLTSSLTGVWDKYSGERQTSTEERNKKLEALEKTHQEAQLKIDEETFKLHQGNMTKHNEETQKIYSERLKAEKTAYEKYSSGMEKTEQTYADNKLKIWQEYNKKMLTANGELRVELDKRDAEWVSGWKLTNAETWGNFAKDLKTNTKVFVDEWVSIWDDVDVKVSEREKKMRDSIISRWDTWYQDWARPTVAIAETIYEGLTSKNSDIETEYDNMWNNMITKARTSADTISSEYQRAMNPKGGSSSSWGSNYTGSRSRLIQPMSVSSVTRSGLDSVSQGASVVTNNNSNSVTNISNNNDLQVVSLLNQLLNKDFVIEDNRPIVENMMLIGSDRELEMLEDKLNIIRMSNARGI